MAIPKQRKPYKRHKPNEEHRRKGEGSQKAKMAEFNALQPQVLHEVEPLPKPGQSKIEIAKIGDTNFTYIWGRHLGAHLNTIHPTIYPYTGKWGSLGVFSVYARPADHHLAGIAMNIHTRRLKAPEDSVWAETTRQRDAIIGLWRQFKRHMTGWRSEGLGFLEFPPERVLFVMSFTVPLVLFDATAKPETERSQLAAALADDRQAMGERTRAHWEITVQGMRDRKELEYNDKRMRRSPHNRFDLAENAHAIALQFTWYGFYGRGDNIRYRKYEPNEITTT